MMRRPQSVLVTGGCGFIGSAFIRYLFGPAEFGGRVTNLDALTYAANPANVAGVADSGRYHFVHGNICDEAQVKGLCEAHEVDTVVHFAAESHVDRSILGPEVFIETNVMGTARLLHVVRALPHIHFHHVSTDEVYGSLGPTGRFRESSPYCPNSPYAASKAASDHLVRAYARTYDLSVTISNCSNNYGPCQFPEKFVPLMISNLLEGKPLPVYGDGSNVRDWLYVEDHAEAIWSIVCQGERGATYNVGGDAERRNLDLLYSLIEVVAELTSRDVESLRSLITFVPDRPGHDQRYAVDFTKLRMELGWEPRHDLSRGLSDTVSWYLDHATWVEQVRSGEYREWIDANYARR